MKLEVINGGFTPNLGGCFLGSYFRELLRFQLLSFTSGSCTCIHLRKKKTLGHIKPKIYLFNMQNTKKFCYHNSTAAELAQKGDIVTIFPSAA